MGCTHLTVTTWAEKILLPALRPNSLVIMDNAFFHNKTKNAKLLSAAGHTMAPPPRYSPDFNPSSALISGQSHFRKVR
jgi:transposase